MRKEWQGGQLVIWQWACVGFSFIVVLIRLYVDFKGLRKGVAWYRDVLIFLAWAFWVINSALTSFMNHYNNFNPDYSTFTNLPAEDQIAANKANWLSLLFGDTMLYMCKVDLLSLYHELAPRPYHPKIFLFILFGWFVVLTSFFMFFIYMFVSCIPISGQWEQLPYSVCFDAEKFVYLFFVPHFISDVVIYAIPCVIIYRMKNMTTERKWYAASMFIVGFVNLACVVITLTTYEVSAQTALSEERMWAVYGSGTFISIVQLLTAMVVVCMPQLKPFYRFLRGKIVDRKVDVDKSDSDRESYETPASPGSRAPNAKQLSKSGQSPEGEARAYNRLHPRNSLKEAMMLGIDLRKVIE